MGDELYWLLNSDGGGYFRVFVLLVMHSPSHRTHKYCSLCSCTPVAVSVTLVQCMYLQTQLIMHYSKWCLPSLSVNLTSHCSASPILFCLTCTTACRMYV